MALALPDHTWRAADRTPNHPPGGLQRCLNGARGRQIIAYPRVPGAGGPEVADLKRSLFGYRAASVRSVLTERDATLQRVSDDARAAQHRAESLTAELGAAQAQLASFQAQLEAAERRRETLSAELERNAAEREIALAEISSLRAALGRTRAELQAATDSLAGRDRRLAVSGADGLPRRPAAPGGDADGPSSTDELVSVLDLTERAVRYLVAATKARADDELRAFDEDRARIGRDAAELAAWKDRAAPTIRTVRETMEGAREEILHVGDRIDDALQPISAAMTQMTTQLSTLDGALREEPWSDGAPTHDGGARVIELRDESVAHPSSRER